MAAPFLPAAYAVKSPCDRDRKSTRLNSSHSQISYAVFCLKKKNVVVVRPKEINDVLVNPGMGITTFQRFNGQEPNPPLKWSEVSPEKKLPHAATKPDFPDTSVSYCRW